MKISLISILSALIFFTGCNSGKKINSQKNMHNIPLDGAGILDKQGHRGCRGLMPENTIPAMIEAIGLGVTTLEMDIVFTKDGKAVVSHEAFFNHAITTKADGSFIQPVNEMDYNIYKMTYTEVSKFDVGMKPDTSFPQQKKMSAVKPLFTDVIDAVNEAMMTRKRPMPLYNIETKTSPETDNVFHPRPEEFVDKLMKIITDKGIEDRVTIQSFDTRTLKYLHKKYPSIKTALLINELDSRSFRKQITDLGFTPSTYSPSKGLVTDVLVASCHEQQIKIVPWTVNDKGMITKFINMGVDGIITDYPNLFND